MKGFITWYYLLDTIQLTHLSFIYLTTKHPKFIN